MVSGERRWTLDVSAERRWTLDVSDDRLNGRVVGDGAVFAATPEVRVVARDL